jgi:hypothetical protein
MLINIPLELLYLLKKPHQNPLDSFKDLSYFVLYYFIDYVYHVQVLIRDRKYYVL